MKTELFITIILAGLGWIFGFFQYYLKRRNQNRDKLVDRRFVAYSSYMKKADELMAKVRTDPNMIFGITSSFIEIALNGTDDEMNDALIQFNEQLIAFVQTATEPLLILKQELNSLKLICSEELSIYIDEMVDLTIDYNNEVQKTLGLISPNDSNELARQLTTLGQNERWLRFESLQKTILKQMRIEIGNN